MPRDVKRRRMDARLASAVIVEEDPAPGVKTLLDSNMFPHILDAIVDFASRESLIALRAVCRSLRKRCDYLLARHLIMYTKEQMDASFLIDDSIPVCIEGPEGRLPMFMNWCDELEPEIWKCLGEEWPETYDDWVQVPVPKVLYPAMITHLETQNSRTRAMRLIDLLSRAEVIDLVGPLPLNRIRELMSGLPSSSRTMLRIRPDGDECSPWTPQSSEYANLHLDDYIEGRLNKWDIEWLWTGRIDTLVHFQSISLYDNIELLSEVHACGLRLFSPYVRKLVIHFSMDVLSFPQVWNWRHRLGYRVHESVEEIVVIFERYRPYPIDESFTPPPSVDIGPTGPLKRFFRDIAEYMPQTKVILVNTAALYPELIGHPRETRASKLQDMCAEYFKTCMPPELQLDFKDHYETVKNSLSLVSLDEYAARIGSERFKLETDGYKNPYHTGEAILEDAERAYDVALEALRALEGGSPTEEDADFWPGIVTDSAESVDSS